MRESVYSNHPLEKKAAYCRAIRTNDIIWVSGTTPVDQAGNIVGKGNMYEQVVFALQKIGAALEKLGANLRDVVRVCLFITDIKQFDEVVRAHHQIFHGIDPTMTCVAVAALGHPEILVEIEANAVVANDNSQ